MARLKGGILGGISGKISDVIGYIRYGKAFVKMKSLKPLKKRTQSQLAAQQKMKVVNAFVNSMTAFVRIGFTLEAANKTHSANAAAKSYQLLNAVTGVYPSHVIDFAEALLCKGDMEPPVNASVAALGNGIQFNWDVSRQTEVYHNQSRAMLLVHAPGLGKSFYTLSGARIMEKSDFMELPVNFKNQLLHAYIAFYADDQKKISNSVYLGSINYQ